MAWEGWVTLFTVLLMAFALMRNLAGPDVVLLGGLTLLMSLSLVSDKFPSPAVAVADFGNEGLITIAVLFVVAEGLSLTGAMNIISGPLLGRPRTVFGAQIRLMAPTAIMSAFLNKHAHCGHVHSHAQRLVQGRPVLAHLSFSYRLAMPPSWGEHAH